MADQEACAGCGAAGAGAVQRCGGCRSVVYCSRACQKVHWKTHKAACRQLRDRVPEGRQLPAGVERYKPPGAYYDGQPPPPREKGSDRGDVSPWVPTPGGWVEARRLEVAVDFLAAAEVWAPTLCRRPLRHFRSLSPPSRFFRIFADLFADRKFIKNQTSHNASQKLKNPTPERPKLDFEVN